MKFSAFEKIWDDFAENEDDDAHREYAA